MKSHNTDYNTSEVSSREVSEFHFASQTSSTDLFAVAFSVYYNISVFFSKIINCFYLKLLSEMAKIIFFFLSLWRASGKFFYGFVSVLSFVHMILLFTSFIFIFYQTNISNASNGFHIYCFYNDNFLNTSKCNFLNVVDVDILSKCCVC